MEKLLDKVQQQTDAAEIFHLKADIDLVIFEYGKLKTLNLLKSEGAAVRGIVDGKMGQIIASDLRNPADIAIRLRRTARLSDPAEFKFGGPADIPKPDLVNESVAAMPVKEITDMGREAVATIKDYDPGITVDFIAGRTRERVGVVTGRGLEA